MIFICFWVYPSSLIWEIISIRKFPLYLETNLMNNVKLGLLFIFGSSKLSLLSYTDDNNDYTGFKPPKENLHLPAHSDTSTNQLCVIFYGQKLQKVAKKYRLFVILYVFLTCSRGGHHWTLRWNRDPNQTP